MYEEKNSPIDDLFEQFENYSEQDEVVLTSVIPYKLLKLQLNTTPKKHMYIYFNHNEENKMNSQLAKTELDNSAGIILMKSPKNVFIELDNNYIINIYLSPSFLSTNPRGRGHEINYLLSMYDDKLISELDTIFDIIYSGIETKLLTYDIMNRDTKPLDTQIIETKNIRKSILL